MRNPGQSRLHEGLGQISGCRTCSSRDAAPARGNLFTVGLGRRASDCALLFSARIKDKITMTRKQDGREWTIRKLFETGYAATCS